MDGKSIDEIVTELDSCFEIDAHEITLDITNFLNELEEMGVCLKKGQLDLTQGKNVISVAIIHIIQNCNSKCIMCDCWKTKGQIQTSRSDLHPLFTKLKMMGMRSIMLTGGEPLLHPEINEIIDDLNQLNISIDLNTNAIDISKMMPSSWNKISKIVVSIDASNKEDHVKIRGDYNFDKIWSNILWIRKNTQNVSIGVRTTINRFNAFNLISIIDKALDIGVDHFGFSPLDVNSDSFARKKIKEGNDNPTSDKLLPTKEEITIFLKKFNRESELYKRIDYLFGEGRSQWSVSDFSSCFNHYMRLHHQKNSSETDCNPCLFPRVSMVLDYNGDLKGCFYSAPFGHIKNLKDVNWTYQNRTQGMIESGICSDCRGKLFCGVNVNEL